MTEAELQKRIAYQFGLINGNIVLPNILLTVGRVGHYEADLLYITPKRYCTEVEIKISMADFKLAPLISDAVIKELGLEVVVRSVPDVEVIMKNR